MNFVSLSFAQIDSEPLFYAKDSLSSAEQMDESDIKPEAKLRWNGSVGTSFIYSRNMGSFSALHGSYGFSRDLNSRFSVDAGLMASTYFPVSGFFNSSESGFQNLSSVSIYGTGSYKLNERLVLYGTGIKHLIEFGPDNPISSYNFNEISFGTTLKLSNSISVGASVHFVDRPYYYHPFSNNRSAFDGFPASW